jgi:DNA-binding transcriptional regulator YdaS (Cro superfamily)
LPDEAEHAGVVAEDGACHRFEAARLRRAHQRVHQQLPDAGVVPVIGDHDAELAAPRAGIRHVARLAHDLTAEFANECHVPVVVDVRVEVRERAGEALEAQPACALRKTGEEGALGLLVVCARRADKHLPAVSEPALADEMSGVRRGFQFHCPILRSQAAGDVDQHQLRGGTGPDTAALDTGLTSAEAAARLAGEGPNALPEARGRRLLGLVRGVLREPMFVLLIAAAAIYVVLGDLREALVLGGSVVLIIAIAVAQERRAERALEALRELASPRALVLRDGERRRIAGTEVVRGDLMLLAEGDRVVADARLGVVNELELDESLLTGESLPRGEGGG